MRKKIINLLAELMADQTETEVEIYEADGTGGNADSIHSICNMGSNKRVDCIRR